MRKGGYSIKNGYYIKNDCKNNESEGSVDEAGYILDPLTYERITEGNIVQLSDGLCYNKSRELARNIRRRNSLPFGHPVNVMDLANFSNSSPSPSSTSISSIPISLMGSDQNISEISLPILSNSDEDIIEVNTRREPVRLNIVPRTTRRRAPRNRPILVIDSSSTEELVPPPRLLIESSSTPNNSGILSTEAQVSPVEEIVIQPRRRGRPPGSRNRNTRGNTRGNTGRGMKRNKKYKTKKQKKH